MQNTTNIPETPTPTPKTINEALNILAYNEFFYQDPLKSHINPHAKDRDTIKSLVEKVFGKNLSVIRICSLCLLG